MTTRSQHLDALRGVAVLAVFLLHLQTRTEFNTLVPSPWNSILLLGMFGVDLFYVLSGFFITYTILKPIEWHPENYLKSRFYRIYPAYLFCLFIMAIKFKASSSGSWGNFISGLGLHLIMAQNLLPNTSGIFNGVFWTLGVEFPYYIIMLAVAPFLRNERLFFKTSFLMIFISITFRAGTYFFLDADGMGGLLRFFASTQIIGTLDYFALGGMAAYFNLTQKNNLNLKKYKLISLALGIFLLIFSFTYVVNSIYGFWNDPFLVILWRTCLSSSFALIIFSISFENKSTFLKYTTLPWIGKISFSFYLWHYPIISSMTLLPEKISTIEKLIYVCIISFIVSWTSWKFIENKFHKFNVKSFT